MYGKVFEKLDGMRSEMFCYECGKQVMDGSAFCSFCGAKFENVVSKNDQQSVTKTSTEYDREAIKIYLNNLLQMENANQVLQHELNRLADEYRYIQNGNYYASYILYDHIKEGPWGDDEFCHLYYDGKDVYIAVTGKYNNVIEVDRYFHETNWIKVDDFEYINKLYHWVRWSGIFSISDTLLKMEIRKRFYASLEEFKSIAPVEFEKNRTRLKQIADSYNRLEKSQEKVDEILQRAYDINIVPAQFRNIYAIYYLSGFMNTSMENFSSALFHLDLDSIKSKLDEIISNQQSIILKMAVLEAQNNELLKNNQQTLNRLSDIENNTKLTAAYSEIAAVNSETCAWFGAATFFQKYLD